MRVLEYGIRVNKFEVKIVLVSTRTRTRSFDREDYILLRVLKEVLEYSQTRTRILVYGYSWSGLYVIESERDRMCGVVIESTRFLYEKFMLTQDQ